MRNLARKWQHRKFLRLLTIQKSKTGDPSIPSEADNLISGNNYAIITLTLKVKNVRVFSA
jgi:hypothetical protein